MKEFVITFSASGTDTQVSAISANSMLEAINNLLKSHRQLNNIISIKEIK